MYKFLFKPIKLGNIELKNRIVFSSIGIDSYSPDGTVTDENISFVKARSIETGMIITTVSMATYKYGRVKFIGSYDDFFIESLSRFAQAGHSGGAKIVLQVSAMGGPNTLADDVFHDIIPYVPTIDIPDFRHQWKGKNKPVELATEQVEEIIQDFIYASLRAKSAGFDGVELFAAEDFLLSSFITPHFNKRSDKYGGSFENMMRMPVEMIRGIRKACGDDFIIGFKYNTYYEFPEGDGIDLPLGIRIGKRLSKEKISYIHEYSYAKHDIPFSLFKYSIMPSQYQPRNSTIEISEALKKQVQNIPIMAVGAILKPDEADQIIGGGKADLVSIGRAFIADNFWAYKAKRNIPVRPCIRCFVCLDEATKSRIIGCSVNPDVLVSENKALKKTKIPKKIIIAGAGPAGIVCALALHEKRHIVELYEKEYGIGGNLVASSVKGLNYEHRDLLDYYMNELKKTNIKLFTSTTVTKEILISGNPDSVVLAIGARQKIPDIDGIGRTNVISVSKAIFNAFKIKNKEIVIIGGQDRACEAALMMARNKNKVTLLEDSDKLMSGNDIEYLTMVLEKMMVEEDVRFYLKFKVLNIGNDFVIAENIVNKNKFKIKCDLVVNAFGFEVPYNEIELLSHACKKIYVIGDCNKPGKLFQAVTQAYETAKTI